MVTLPYNLLLQPSARDALGINLQDQVVVIDEAHSMCFASSLYYFLIVHLISDLISSILTLSTITMTYQHLNDSLNQISAYLSKFRLRLSSHHALHLVRLKAFMKAFIAFIHDWRLQRKLSSERYTVVMTVHEIMHTLGQNMDAVNLLEIHKYLRTSKVTILSS